MNAELRLLAVLTIFSSAAVPLATSAAAEAAPASPPHVSIPHPPYPYTARRNNEQGSGMFEFSTDAAGKTQVVIVRSTGYADLDENVVNYGRTHWKGPPNITVKVPVDYRLTAQDGDSHLGKAVRGQWYTPPPHYPPASVRFLESGDGVVKVTTDATGRVVNAEMVKSTGTKRLDENSIHYASSFWQGPPNSTREVPVRYAMKAPHY